MYRILIVEDDAVIARKTAEHIAAWGWQTRTVGDFMHVMEEFREFDPHLVLMDIALPFYNGYHWCSEIRRESRTPVIFVSSASDNLNIVMAMNMGGDDFIAKPFDLDVLTAKVQALLRRTYDFSIARAALERGSARLDTAGGLLTGPDGTLELTKNEHKVLCELMENAGRPVSRERLMERLWETDSFVDENTLSVLVARLRRKLEGIGLGELVVTKKGLGYMVE